MGHVDEVGCSVRPLSVTRRPSGMLLVRLEGPTPGEELSAALLDALTSRPDGVVVDLSRTRRGLLVDDTHVEKEIRTAVVRALRDIAPWPHAPVVFVMDELAGAALAGAAGPGCVDVVPSLAVAEAAFPGRRRVSSAVTTLRPPLLSRAVARGLTLEFAQTCGLPPRVDAAMLAADELTARAIHDSGSGVELRLAARKGTLGVAVADTGSSSPRHGFEAPPGPGGGLALVEAMADAFGTVARAGGGNLTWAVFTWTSGTEPAEAAPASAWPDQGMV